MSSLGDNIGKFFKPKIDRKKKEAKAKAAGLPQHIMDMEEGSDKDRAIAVHRANEKAKNRDNSYECGGVKYSKLKDKLKGKKK